MRVSLKDFKVGFPIASVWLGAMVGPSLLTGVFAMQYFAPYGGWTSILLMIFNVAISAIIVALAADIARRNKAYHFGDMSRAMYGKYNIIFGTLLNILMICSVLVNAAALLAVWKTLMFDVFGAPPIVGTISIIIVCTFLCIYGADIVRKASAIMTVILFIGMIALFGFSVWANWGNWSSILSNSTPVEGFTMGRGIWRAFVLGFYQTTIAMHLSAVQQTLETKQHTVAFGICSFLMILFAFCCTELIVLPYASELVTSGVSIPIYRVVTTKFGTYSKIGSIIYSITMFFAIISSFVPIIQSSISRFDPYYPKTGVFNNSRFRYFISVVLFWIIAIFVSKVGLTALIGKAWLYLGYVSLPLIVIPCVILPLKLRREERISDSEPTG